MVNAYKGASYRGAYGEQPMRQDYGREESHEYWMKIDLPTFNKHLHIKDFLDWVTEVERFFKYMSIPEEHKLKLVVYKFKGGASAWWEQLQISRARQGKEPVTLWLRMKRLSKHGFYHQTLSNIYSSNIKSDDKELAQSRRISMAFINCPPETISWRQEHSRWPNLLEGCV